MNKPIGTIVCITKVLYIHALWEVGDIGIVVENGIFAITKRSGYSYIPEEQYLFEDV